MGAHLGRMAQTSGCGSTQVNRKRSGELPGSPEALTLLKMCTLQGSTLVWPADAGMTAQTSSCQSTHRMRKRNGELSKLIRRTRKARDDSREWTILQPWGRLLLHLPQVFFRMPVLDHNVSCCCCWSAPIDRID